MTAGGRPEAMIVLEIDIDPEFEEAFNRWYDDRHLPEVCALPGILSATRLRVTGAEGRYLTIYALSDPGAFETDAYRKWRAASRDTDEMMARFRRVSRTHASVISARAGGDGA